MIDKNKKKQNFEEEFIPIPIQFFFWNQTGSFIKHKFGNLTEAHAMNFERVLVQNIRHGLSPGLSDAISSISRWKLLRTAFPYITHASFASLFFKKNQSPSLKLGKADMKLLHTLNWLLLDAPSESSELDAWKESSVKITINGDQKKSMDTVKATGEANQKNFILENIVKSFEESKSFSSGYNESTEEVYIYPISMMQLFIYLFIPIVKSLNENGLNSLKLNNGEKIWEQLWNHMVPDIPLFNNPINSKFYKTIESHKLTEKLLEKENDENKEKIAKLQNSDTLNNSKQCNLENIQQRVKSENTIQSNQQSFSFLPSEIEDYDYQNGNNIRFSHFLIKTVGDDIINDIEEFSRKAPLVHMSSICSFIDTPTTQNGSPFGLSKRESLNENESQIDSSKLEVEKSAEEKTKEKDSPATFKKNDKDATFFDIALIRCIFNSKWQPEGYIWSLEYLYNRVTKIAEEIHKEQENYVNINTTSISLPNLNQSFSKYKIRNNKKDKHDILRNLNEAKKSQKCELGLTFVFDNWIKTFKYIDEDPIKRKDGKNHKPRCLKKADIEKFTLSQYKIDDKKVENSEINLNMSRNMIKIKKRSSSDCDIYYKKYDTSEEVVGSAGLVHNDGTLDLDIILKSVHAIVYKESSIKICEMTINILEILMNIGIIPNKERYRKLANNDKMIPDELQNFIVKKEEKYAENFGLAINIILRNIKWLSCSYCKSSSQTISNADPLKNRIKILLIKLQKKNPKLFELCFKTFIEENEIDYIFHTLHALLGYCLSQGATQFSMKSSSTGFNEQQILQSFKPEAFTFFEKNLSSLIIKALLKPILRKILKIEKNQENIHIYFEIKIFFSFLRENHKDIYHRIIFSSMLDPMLNLKRKNLIKPQELHKFDLEFTTADSFIQAPMENSITEFKNDVSIFNCVDDQENYEGKNFDDTEKITNQKYNYQFLDLNLLTEGLNFYRLLIECSPPATVPNISFMISLQDLEAPMISKISFLSETAYFISQSSKIGGPDLFLLNLTNCRSQQGSIINTRNIPSNLKKNKNFQTTVADGFYAWGEILASKLECLIEIQSLKAKNGKEFIDYATIDSFINDVFSGSNSLKSNFDIQMVICSLLLEISSFIREIYPQITKKPKTIIHATMNREKNVGSVFSNESSSVNDTLANSEVYQQNLNSFYEQESSTNIVETVNKNEAETAKHISFVFQEETVNTDKPSDNQVTEFETNNETVSIVNSNGKQKLPLQTKRSSLKHSKKVSTKNKIDRTLRNRKLSYNTQVSDIREQEISENNCELSEAEPLNTTVNNIQANSVPQDSSYDLNNDIVDLNKSFPWINIILKTIERFNFNCDHFDCQQNCFLQSLKRCRYTMDAILRLYEYNETLNQDMIIKQQGTHSTSNNLSGKKIKDSDRKVSVISLNSLNLNHINSFLQSNGFFYGQIRNNIKILQKTSIHTTGFYLKKNIQNFIYTPLELLCKSANVIQEEYFGSIIKIAWNLLLQYDQEIASASTTLILICGIKQPILTEEFLKKEFKSKCPITRYNAILKLEVIWKFRQHMWPHLESNAHLLLKVTPPCIEFILPSPPIGQSLVPIIDPPWLPKTKKNIEEVAINQEEIRAVVTTSKSRKKYQQEVLTKALQAEERSKRLARESFNITATSYLQNASYEPILHQNKDDQAEGTDEVENSSLPEINQSQAVFPTSIASVVVNLIDLLSDYNIGQESQPINELCEKVILNCLIDDSPLFLRYFFEKITQKEKKDFVLHYIRRLVISYIDLPVQTAYILLNYLLGVIIFYGRTPSEGSQETIANVMNILWQIVANVNGIVFKDLKQILKKEQCDPSILITANVPSAKKLIIHGPDLSQIPTQSLINEDTRFIGVMQESFDFFSIQESKRDKYFLFDVKSNQIHLPDTYVRDFYFFRRNHYPQLTLVYMEPKDSIQLLEKTAFSLKMLEQSKVLFFEKILDNLPFNQVHSIGVFVLEELNKIPTFPRKALEADFNLYSKLSDRELSAMDMLHKYSWLKLIWSLFSTMDSKTTSLSEITIFLNVINGAFVLHCEDLNMLRSCLAVYITIVKYFQQIFSANGFLLILPAILKVYTNMQTNQMLKRAIEFLCSKFYIMHRIPFLLQLFASITQANNNEEIKPNLENKAHSFFLFTLLIGMEQDFTDELKIVDLSQSFESSFSKSNEMNNIKKSDTTNHNNLGGSSMQIEMKTSQNNMNTGASSKDINNINIINSNNNNNLLNPPSAILAAAGINAAGILNSGHIIGSSNNNLVKSHDGDRNNIKPLDFCYSDLTNNKFSMLDAINLCVTVIAYATHANRAHQMLIVLDTIIPQYMDHLKSETDSMEPTCTIKKEHEHICKISLALKTMINSIDVIARNFYSRSELLNNNYKNSNSYSHRSPSILPDEDSMRFLEEKRLKVDPPEDKKSQKNDLYLIHDLILKISSNFIFDSLQRFKETDKVSNNINLKLELLDNRAHNKLAEISQSLLKHSDDAIILNGSGLQSYFQKLMPLTDWTQEALKGTFTGLLRRVDRCLKKLLQRTSIKKIIDWNAAAGIVYGLYLTLERQESLLQLPFFKSFINSTIIVLLSENVEVARLGETIDSNRLEINFFKTLIRLIGHYIGNIKEQKNLEQFFTSLMTGSEIQNTVGISYLISFLIPLLLWNSSNRQSPINLNQEDISFAVTIILSSLKISSKAVTNMVLSIPKSQVIDSVDASFVKFQHLQSKSIRNIKDLISQAAFLSIKIIQYESIENFELTKIAMTIAKMSAKIKNVYLWKFFEFICSYRNPLFILLKPIIESTITNHCFENEEDFKISKEIRTKLDGSVIVNNKSKIKVLNDLTTELSSMRKDYKGEKNLNPHKTDLSVNSKRTLENVISKKLEESTSSNEMNNNKVKIQNIIDYEPIHKLKIHKKFDKIDGKNGMMILETYIKNNSNNFAESI